MKIGEERELKVLLGASGSKRELNKSTVTNRSKLDLFSCLQSEETRKYELSKRLANQCGLLISLTEGKEKKRILPCTFHPPKLHAGRDATETKVRKAQNSGVSPKIAGVSSVACVTPNK
jgi:hypothetical protein